MATESFSDALMAELTSRWFWSRDDRQAAIATFRALFDGQPVAVDEKLLDTFQRIAAALLVVIRRTRFRRWGWQERRYGRNGPGVRRYPGGSYVAPHGGGFDHLRRLVHPATQQDLYVTEPYGLGQQELRALLDLADREGWTLSIDERFGLHYPGATVPVVFRRRQDAHHGTDGRNML